MVPIFGKFMSYITREKSSSKETKLRRAVQPGLTAENIRYDSPFPLDITTGEAFKRSLQFLLMSFFMQNVL